jgi:hypothetical protein
MALLPTAGADWHLAAAGFGPGVLGSLLDFFFGDSTSSSTSKLIGALLFFPSGDAFAVERKSPWRSLFANCLL